MVMVEIYVPSVDTQYDFLLEENVKVFSVIEEICEVLNNKLKGSAQNLNSDFILCSLDYKKILAMDKTLKACGVKDGSRLLLV